MYSDPKYIKKHPYKVSLNDEQRQLIESAAAMAGEQPTAYLRELALERLRELLQVDSNDHEAA